MYVFNNYMERLLKEGKLFVKCLEDIHYTPSGVTCCKKGRKYRVVDLNLIENEITIRCHNSEIEIFDFEHFRDDFYTCVYFEMIIKDKNYPNGYIKFTDSLIDLCKKKILFAKCIKKEDLDEYFPLFDCHTKGILYNVFNIYEDGQLMDIQGDDESLCNIMFLYSDRFELIVKEEEEITLEELEEWTK